MGREWPLAFADLRPVLLFRARSLALFSSKAEGREAAPGCLRGGRAHGPRLASVGVGGGDTCGHVGKDSEAVSTPGRMSSAGLDERVAPGGEADAREPRPAPRPPPCAGLP